MRNIRITRRWCRVKPVARGPTRGHTSRHQRRWSAEVVLHGLGVTLVIHPACCWWVHPCWGDSHSSFIIHLSGMQVDVFWLYLMCESHFSLFTEWNVHTEALKVWTPKGNEGWRHHWNRISRISRLNVFCVCLRTTDWWVHVAASCLLSFTLY